MQIIFDKDEAITHQDFICSTLFIERIIITSIPKSLAILRGSRVPHWATMEFAFCTISEVLTYIGFAPFQFIPVSILTHIVSHKRDSVLLALRTVLLWGVLFVFLLRKPIGIHNSLAQSRFRQSTWCHRTRPDKSICLWTSKRLRKQKGSTGVLKPFASGSARTASATAFFFKISGCRVKSLRLLCRPECFVKEVSMINTSSNRGFFGAYHMNKTN